MMILCNVNITWTLVSSMNRTMQSFPFIIWTFRNDLSKFDRCPAVKLKILCRQTGTGVTCPVSLCSKEMGTWPPRFWRRVSPDFESLPENCKIKTHNNKSIYHFYKPLHSNLCKMKHTMKIQYSWAKLTFPAVNWPESNCPISSYHFYKFYILSNNIKYRK